MPSWSKTEAFGETVAVTDQSGGAAASGIPARARNVGSAGGSAVAPGSGAAGPVAGSASSPGSGSAPVKRTHEQSPHGMGDTAYAVNRPRVDPAKIAANDPLIGKTVDHFEIRALLGEGGMGRVYLAHDMSLQRPVALKMLRLELADNPELVGRLVEEARAQARIQHPHVVGVYYIGDYQGAPYIAMEYVEGMNMSEYLVKNGPLSWQDALEVIIQTTRALFHAHLKQFSHRDVKPSNIIFVKGSQYRSSNINIKVADFGLAAPVGRREEHFMGTPRYAAPEAVDGRRHDHRSDIYALGITFYELIMGAVPFDSNSLAELFAAHRHAERPTIPEDQAPWKLRELIREMMDADPMKRPTTYEDVLDRLTSLRDKPINPGAIPARSVALAIDLAMVFGFSQLVSDRLYLMDTTSTQAALALYCIYYVGSHRAWGATLGKRLMGLRIQGAKHAVTLGRLFLRFLVHFWGPILAVIMISVQFGSGQKVSDMSQVAGEVVGGKIPILQRTLEPVLRQVLVPSIWVAIPWIAGFFFAFLDRSRMTLHDRAGSTKVVSTTGEQKENQVAGLSSLRKG